MTESTVPPIAVQLYSLRHFSDDFATQIATVAELGYTGVELVGLSLSPERVSEILAEHTVKAVSAHVSYQALSEDLDKLLHFHQMIGNSWVIVPAPPQDVRETNTVESWLNFAKSLEAFGRRCFDAKVRLGYHNHRWEMVELEGKRVIDWMMDETDPDYLFFEPDLAWIAAGGADPKAILDQYAGRCPRVHVKDLAPAGENEDEMGLADVGYGTLDWNVLLPAARAAGAEWYVVEHDKPKDPVVSVGRSLEFLRSQAELIL
jgi:sugar phosphate isomerase/epimerase